MDDLRLASIRRLTLGFQILVGAALAVIGFVIVHRLWANEFHAGFFTVRGLQSVTEKDLVFSQRVVVVGLAAMPDMCWIYGLLQLLGASWRFRRAEFFSNAAITRFRRFGWALAAMGVAEALSRPLLVAYLIWLKKIDPPESWWQYAICGETFNSLLAAILVLIVARILQIAMQIDQESRLTI